MTAPRTVRVRTAFGELVAPRGFGASYRRAAKAHAALLAAGKPGEVIWPLRDLLLLIGYDASAEVIADWPAKQRIEAEVYAANVHLGASDHPLQRHPKPAWLPAPYQGPYRGQGVDDFMGPAPTVLGSAP